MPWKLPQLFNRKASFPPPVILNTPPLVTATFLRPEPVGLLLKQAPVSEPSLTELCDNPEAALLLAESLIKSNYRQIYWDSEAQKLFAATIQFVCNSSFFDASSDKLASVWEILLGAGNLEALALMLESDIPLTASAALDFLKTPKHGRALIIATLRVHCPYPAFCCPLLTGTVPIAARIFCAGFLKQLPGQPFQCLFEAALSFLSSSLLLSALAGLTSLLSRFPLR